MSYTPIPLNHRVTMEDLSVLRRQPHELLRIINERDDTISLQSEEIEKLKRESDSRVREVLEGLKKECAAHLENAEFYFENEEGINAAIEIIDDTINSLSK
jgi:hypothetical protein